MENTHCEECEREMVGLLLIYLFHLQILKHCRWVVLRFEKSSSFSFSSETIFLSFVWPIVSLCNSNFEVNYSTTKIVFFFIRRTNQKLIAHIFEKMIIYLQKCAENRISLQLFGDPHHVGKKISRYKEDSPTLAYPTCSSLLAPPPDTMSTVYSPSLVRIYSTHLVHGSTIMNWSTDTLFSFHLRFQRHGTETAAAAKL